MSAVPQPNQQGGRSDNPASEAGINDNASPERNTHEEREHQKSKESIEVTPGQTSGNRNMHDSANGNGPTSPVSEVNFHHNGDAEETKDGQETPVSHTASTKNSANGNGARRQLSLGHEQANGGVKLYTEDLGLGNISENTIRQMLDPDETNVNPLQLFDWPEAKLDRLVEVLKPEHLAVLIKKRMETSLEENAKTLSWHNITYTTKSGIKILDDVSGYILPGMCVGLLGAPDSGITPLLQVLAGEHGHYGKIEGTVLYDGHKPDSSFRRQVGFAVKQDTHLAHLTVFESLFFSARLRLPDAIPDKVVRYRVKMAMKLLGISHTANTPVGDAILRGISGGEKRRLGFGLEMVAGHSIILADLPTNGLDSATAYGLIRTMAFACRGGFSLMASLVQPSLELFLLLDRVMLLSKGRTIYFGPPGSAEAFFRGHGFHRPPNKSVPQFLEELSAKPEQFWLADNVGDRGLGESFYQPPGQQADEQEAREREQQNADGTPRRVAWTYLTKRFSDDDVNKRVLKELEHIKDAKEHHQPHSIDDLDHDHHGDNGAAEGHRNPKYPSLPSFDAESGQPKQKYASDGEFDNISNALEKDVIPRGGQRKQQSVTPNGGMTASKRSKSSKAISADGSHLVNQHNKGLLKGWYKKYNSGPWSQFKWNLWRQNILTIRNVGLWRDIWLISLAMGFIIGSLFYMLPTSEIGVRNRVGEFFYILSYIGFNAVQLVPVLHEQREVYYSQVERGYYQTFGYYFSLLLVQFPICIVDTLVLLVPLWGLSGLTGYPFISPEFWYGYLIVLMNSLVSRVWMFVLYAGSPNEVYADVLNQVTNILFTKLAGYFIAADRIVGGWKWMYVISYFTYSLLGLAVNDVCPTTNVNPATGQLCTPTPDYTCRFQTGPQGLELLYTMSCTDMDKWWYFADGIWFFLTFNLAGYAAFWLINWSQADVPEFPNFGEQEGGAEEDDVGDKGTSVPQIRVDGVNNDNTQGSRTQNTIGRNDRSLTRRQQEQRNLDTNQGTWRRLAAPQIPVSRARSDIVVDTHYLEQAGLAVPNSPGLGAQEMKQPSPQPADMNQLSLSRTSQNSMTNSQSMHYGHRVRTTDTTASALSTQKGATCEWYNLDYDVPVKTDDGKTIQRRLLNKVYGYCTPGMMVALMGATGAGKTTLLDVLAGKKTGGKIMGTLLINGKTRDASFSHIAGYVEQFDSHNPFSTLREAIIFSGRLRLPPETSYPDVIKKVEAVLDILGLRHLQHEMIGGPGLGGVSQEIRKKVTIAVELIMEPQLLFLDEPTTGLDSAGAFAVMCAVRNLAKSISVICTIHQPAAEIVGMFDWLLLLRPGGHVVYFAPMKNLPTYFREHGIGECAPEKNIADFALERVKAVDSSYTQKMEKNKDKGTTAEPEEKGPEEFKDEDLVKADGEFKQAADGSKDLAKEFKASREGKDTLNKLEKGIAPRDRSAEQKELDDNVHAGPRTNFAVQFNQLNKRFYLNYIRNRQTLGVRMFLTFFMGFVVGTVFLRQDFSQAASDQRVSAVFVTLLFVMFTANAFLPDVFSTRPMYFREVTSDMYGPGAFYIARYTADIPFVIFENLVLAIMVDFIANLGTDPVGPFFGWFFFALIATRYASITCTFAIGTVVELANNANTIHATYFNLLFAFSGFLIPGPSIPPWWWWFYDIDFLRWALHFIAADMEREQQYYCNPNENELIPVYPQFYKDCPLTAQDYYPGQQNAVQGSTPAGLAIPQGANGPYPGGLIDYTQTGNTIYNAGQAGQVYQYGPSVFNFQAQDGATQNVLVKCNWQCGIDLLNYYGVKYTDGWLAVELCVVWGFAVFFGVIGYIALWKINHVNR